jgi:cyanophycinase
MPTPPIYLLADSQLLFWANGDRPFLSKVRDALQTEEPSAAYIGASNGDRREFFSIFASAIALAGIREVHMISSRYGPTDRARLREADILLLAGGDVHLGWQIMHQTGLGDDIVDTHRQGAVLIGVSAGAVQLGLRGWLNDWPISTDDLFDAFGLVPFVVDAHDEANHWARLKAAVELTGPPTQGLGLPAGAGTIYHADSSLEPARKPVVEFRYKGLELVQTVLLPAD